MTKFIASVEQNIPTLTMVEENITPRQYLAEDERNKKSAIYHPPIKTRNYQKEYGMYIKKCGDVTSWKAGVPMSLEDFLMLPSDDSRAEYLQSIIDKYKGISIRSLSMMFNINDNTMANIVRYLGVKLDIRSGRHDRATNDKFREDIEKYFNDPEAKNLKIQRRKALPNLPRYTYSELVKMPIDRQRTYFYNIMDRYCHFLHKKMLCRFFECSNRSIVRLMKSIGYESPITIPISLNLCKLTDEMDKRFEEEMLSKRRSFPSRKVSSINETIDDIIPASNTPIELVAETPVEDTMSNSLEQLDEALNTKLDDEADTEQAETTTDSFGINIESMQFTAKLDHGEIFSEAFKKKLAALFGENASIKIKIDKM